MIPYGIRGGTDTWLASTAIAGLQKAKRAEPLCQLTASAAPRWLPLLSGSSGPKQAPDN